MRLSDNQRGAGLMTLAMALFVAEDSFMKGLSGGLPIGQIMLTMGVAGAFFFAALTLRAGQSLMPPEFFTRPMAVRSCFEITGRVFYGLAIAMTPFSSTASILQAAPLVVIAGAALIFGERVSLARWAAVFIGFIGVLIILRPGTDGFSALSLLAVLGTLGFAGRDLATRAAPKTMSNSQLGVLGFIMLAFSGLVILLISGGAKMPPIQDWALLALCTTVSVFGYKCLTQAMRTGEVSAVTPFRYSRLLGSVIVAVLFFGEALTLNMVIGAVMIVVSGIYGLTRR